MAVEHLTDDQLQDYLDGNLDRRQEQIAAHLETCPACRTALAQYKKLYLGLQDETGFELPANFAASVAARVASQEQPQKQLPPVPRGRLVETLVIAFALVATACAIYFFVDLSALYTNTINLLAGAGLDNAFLTAIGSLLSALGVKNNLLVFAGTVLLLTAIAERLLTLARHGKTMFLA